MPLNKINLLSGIKIRKLQDDNDVALPLSSIFIMIFLIIVIAFLQISKASGVDIWAPLLSNTFIFTILITGIIFAVFSLLKIGFYYPILLTLLVWILAINVYIRFETNLI